MIAPAATFSGACTIEMLAAISIGTNTPPDPQRAFANGASATSATAASRPPSSLNPSASSNRRRSLPQRSDCVYRKPYLTRASSIVRSRSTWKKVDAEMTAANRAYSSRLSSRVATTVVKKPSTAAV